MEWSAISAFALFVLVMTWTPGPGNLTFMAVGASSGYRAAFPIIMASMLGGALLHVSVSFGLGQFMANGGWYLILFKIVCLAYMTYLALRIIRLNISDRSDISPPGFWEGLLIHPLSPKTWAMSTVAYTSFFAANGLNTLENMLFLTIGFAIGGFTAHSMWAIAGASILRTLGQGTVLRTVTIVMAIGMVGATIWSLFL